MNELHRDIVLEKKPRRTLHTTWESRRRVPPKGALESLLTQVIRRRPYITALALISPGGKLWASAMPSDVEAESVAAMAAPVALLGRRVALEQLGSDMRQAYVEGEGGYAILRAIDERAILLTVASADSNLALVLHDVELLEGHVAHLMGATPHEVGKWTREASSIEDLRRATSEAPAEVLEVRLDDLRAKLNSLDLGFFPERVESIRAKLQDSRRTMPQDLAEIESELLALEQDVMNVLEQETPSPASPAASRPGVKRQNSFLRRALGWLASMIESED